MFPVHSDMRGTEWCSPEQFLFWSLGWSKAKAVQQPPGRHFSQNPRLPSGFSYCTYVVSSHLTCCTLLPLGLSVDTSEVSWIVVKLYLSFCHSLFLCCWYMWCKLWKENSIWLCMEISLRGVESGYDHRLTLMKMTQNILKKLLGFYRD
jgi:hypothetical protein